MEYPVYEEIGTIGDLSFIVKDLSIEFCIKAERNNELWNNYNLIKDATNLTDEQIESLDEESIYNLIEHINEISKSDDEDESNDYISIEETVALLISKGHLYAHTYRLRFFKTAIKVLSDGLSKSDKKETKSDSKKEDVNGVVNSLLREFS